MFRRVLVCLLVLLWSANAFAAPPEDVVRQLYQTHLKYDRLDKTVQVAWRCFTPGFLGIIERALARTPASGSFVDIDFLTQSQGGWGDFEVGQAQVSGKDAVVPLKVWAGLRSHGPDGPLASQAERTAMRKRIQPTPVRVHLTDVGDGDGFQIKDIEFPANNENKLPAWWVRDWLSKVAQGR